MRKGILILPFAFVCAVSAFMLLTSGKQADHLEHLYITWLSDTSQAVRDRGAEQLRLLIERDGTTYGPGHIREHDSAYWYNMVAKTDMRRELNDVVKALGLQSAEQEMGMCFGQGCYDTYRLDNSMVILLYYNSNKPNTVYFDTIERQLKHTYVDIPKKYNGTWVTYYVNGQRASSIECRNGNYNGELISYYDNGRVSYKQHYDERGANGTDSGFYSSGKLSYAGNYVNGKQEGTWTHYFENGNVKLRSTYIDGELDGAEQMYYENGTPYWESTYDHGKQTRHRSWDAQGRCVFDTDKK